MAEFMKYRRTAIAEIADWVPGMDMTRVSVSAADQEAGSPKSGDKIARNPANHDDLWLIAADYFAANFEPLGRVPAVEPSAPTEPREPLEAPFALPVRVLVEGADYFYVVDLADELVAHCDYRSIADHIATAINAYPTLAALREREARLREALAPFARIDSGEDEEERAVNIVSVGAADSVYLRNGGRITNHDLRRAARALATSDPGSET